METMKFTRIETDDTLVGKKYTMMYRGDKYYISIFPGEIFFSTERENDQKLAASLSTISRFVSMALQAYTLEEVLDQLAKSSRSNRDIPGILHALLKESEM